jgi:hypothetical protein
MCLGCKSRQIEVTPAMIDAGIRAWLDHRDKDDCEPMVAEIIALWPISFWQKFSNLHKSGR